MASRPAPLDASRSIIPHAGGDRGPQGTGASWLADSSHARPVGPLRRLRRPPARPRQPGAGRRPGPAARAARHRRPGRAHRHLADGEAGLARAGPARRRPRVPRHRRARSAASTRPPTGSTGAPRPAWDGTLAPRVRRRRRPTAPPATGCARDLAFLGYAALADRRVGQPVPARRARRRSLERAGADRRARPRADRFDPPPTVGVGPRRAAARRTTHWLGEPPTT